MKLIIFISVFLMSTGVSYAQKLYKSSKSSFYTYYYKISSEQVRKIYQKGDAVIDSSYFIKLVDSFPSSQNKPTRKIPFGSYLITKVEEDKMLFRLEEISNVWVNVVNNDRDLQISVQDTTGAMISNANVSVEGKRISFDKKLNLYRNAKSYKKGILEITYQGHTTYINLNARFKRDFWRKFYYKSYLSSVWFYLKKPFKDIVRAIRYFDNPYQKPLWIWRLVAIFNKEEREDLRDFLEITSEYNSKNDKTWKGYHVFSKPKYRPKDTLKCKLFVLEQNQKPAQEPLTVYLRGFFKNKEQEIKISTIQPYRAGAYIFEMPLHDSLQMRSGSRYRLIFKTPSFEKYEKKSANASAWRLKRKKGYKEIDFKFEDYELKNVAETSLRLEKNKHHQHESNYIYLSAKDANGLFQTDMRVEIFVFHRNITQVEKEELFIPDTLWKHTQLLEPSQETKIAIPDSIFKHLDFEYNVQAIFTNADGERSIEKANAYRSIEKGKVDLLALRDTLRIRYADPQNYADKPAQLIVKNMFGKVKKSQSIRLPYLLRIEKNERYEVTNFRGEIFEYDAYQSLSGVSCYAERTKDSLFISIQNKRGLPLWYYIFEEDKPYSSDFRTESILLNKKIPAHKNYFLSVSYWWEGKIKKEDYAIPVLEKELKIELKTPETIVPGAKTTIEASVTDITGKPLEDVDVTLYGITAKFKQVSHSDFEKVRVKRPPQRIQKNSFSLKPIETPIEGKQAILWQQWKKRLDSIPYYQFLRPEKGLFFSAHASEKKITQIAPYVTNNGTLDSIYYVLVDEKPVFSSFTLHHVYSFEIPANSKTIKIRTPNSLITLKNLKFKEKHKHILSVENHVGKTWRKDSVEIQVESRIPKALSYELDYLRQFILFIDKNYINYYFPAYVTQSEKFWYLGSRYEIPLPEYQGAVAVGFVNPSYKIRYVDYLNFEVTVPFKAGYKYNFEPNLAMAEKMDFSNFKWKPIVPTTIFDDEVYTLKDFEDEKKGKQNVKPSLSKKIYYYKNPTRTSKGLGTIRIEANKAVLDSLEHIILMSYKGKMLDEVRLYSPQTMDFHELTDKTNYQFLYLYENNRFGKITLQARKNGTLYKKLEQISLQKDDSTAIKIRQRLDIHSKENYSFDDADKIRLCINGDEARKATFSEKKNGRFGKIMDLKSYVFDKRGNAVIGAAVYVKGNIQKGTVTDVDGAFVLRDVSFDDTIVISALDYQKREIPASQKKVFLELEEDAIQDIVVTGYGIEQRRSMTGSTVENVPVQNFDRLIQGRTPGITIRGMGSSNTSTEALYIIDGQVVSPDEFAKLDPNVIKNLTTLQDSQAVAIYGSRGANGVIIVETSIVKLPENNATSEAAVNILEGSGLRSNFRDDAVWQPRLRTDKNGKITFTTTFPDDLTRWEIYALAGKEGGLFGMAKSQIRATKQLTASLAMPRFAIAGDSIEVLGKANNYTQDSLWIETRFEIDKKITSTQKKLLINGLVEKQWLQVPLKDTLSVLFALQKEEYTDGERRELPVYPKGTKEAKGYFANFYKDTLVTWQFDKNKGKVKLEITVDLLQIVERELEHLHSYEHLCNEQASAKLLAYLMDERICKIKNKPFLYAKEVNGLIARLEKNVNENNLWGWWGVSNTANWVSKQVIRALLQAQEQGYKVTLPKDAFVKHYVAELSKSKNIREKVENLEMLEQLKADLNYDQITKEIEQEHKLNSKEKKNTNLLNFQDYLSLQLIRQANKLPYNLDTLAKTRKKTIFGNDYWGNMIAGDNEIVQNTIQTTLRALRLLQNAPNTKEQQVLAVNYLLEQRKNNGYWLNTYESITVLETLYPYITNEEEKTTVPNITLSGALEANIQNFPYNATFDPEKSLSIRRNSKLFTSVYISAYQEFWNENPDKVSNGFEVKSFFAENRQPKSYLEVGKPVELVVEVNAKEAKNYILVEIPIPAGCSYENDAYTPYFWDKQRNKVCIFLERIQAGKNTFAVRLQPRYTGIYTLNPAKIEMMYQPILMGRETVRKVKIQ